MKLKVKVMAWWCLPYLQVGCVRMYAYWYVRGISSKLDCVVLMRVLVLCGLGRRTC